ncbi:MAG: type IX secretion system sortase PorU, partial [Bacteroidales bacterium]|nr:type IX secretion system sortase PorU [Bacteroidales bacterium]
SSRFDDPARTSAGEYVFLNPHGGGLALFTTTRATFGSPNYNLNKSIYRFAFQKINGSFPKMGDVLMLAKQQSGSDNNGRKFILLGDPAQRLAYPEYNVVTTAINNQEISSSPDTVNALSVVTIAGEVRDCDGEKMSTFNGTIHTTVFDKPLTIKTQANDGGIPRSFEIMKSILYKGKTSVSNGEFSFTFIVPKDIAYRFGNGKISYYAQDGQIDANGYYKNIIIGGYDENMVPEENGPLVRLFMNDEYFVNGGMTDENPELLAILSDESGINTVGNGIGHDITAILDGNTDEIKVLNEYYESDLNTYKSGVIKFPYFGLSEGTHQIKFKVWDVYNNSSDATIDFLVVSSENFSIEELINYPNPFSEYTYFTFQHNQTAQPLDIEIQIFSITGQLVRTINKDIYAEGYKSEPIQWYGDSNYGSKLDRGIYIYRVIITNSIGEQTSKQQKLIIVR